MTLTTTQNDPWVPIWALINDATDVGCVTCFPGEGFKATVRHGNEDRTVSGASLSDVVANAVAEFDDMVAYADYAENEMLLADEDGDLAFQRMMENRYERFEHDDDPIW
jgi:hypothetical protein